ncbi:MAG TPA: phosphatase PAP2 family protein [Gemmatimonadaceae bacterium]|nr:phosphatase PAP2 family protein [Gemmatimonadaceae bacterium]
MSPIFRSHAHRVATIVAAALIAIAVLGAPVQAQMHDRATQARDSSSVSAVGIASPTHIARPDSVSGSLFTPRDAIVAGAFVAGTAVMLPFDERLASWFQRPSLQRSTIASNVATGARVLGIPGTLIIAPALYVVGRVGHHEHAADLGLHAGEALVVALGTTWFIKGIAGRARPYAVRDTNSYDFAFGRGFSGGEDDSSFPSGHATAAFAMAAATTAETSRWWPGSARYMAPLLYGSATLVGLSRMYDDKHWASDVVFGAAIGTFSGWKVVRVNHEHPHNWIDRVFLSAVIAPTASGGALLVWSVRTQ